MKKSLILLAALLASLSGFSQTLLRQQAPVTENPNPFDVAHGLSQSQLEQIAKAGRGQTMKRPARQLRPTMKADAAVDTVDYFTAAQSYYANYAFNASGGEVKTYHVGVAVNGNEVTFKNFFNLYNPTAYAPSIEYNFTGTYDAKTKTITVPTSTTFDNATIVANLMQYYAGTLVAGTVDENGKLIPDDNLVLHVDGDFERIYTTDQAVGISMWTPDGATNYGVSGSTALLKGISINLPKDDAYPLVFNKSISFGDTYAALPVTRTMTIVNMGKAACDYAMEIDSDPEDAFTADALSGTVEGESTKDITFTFSTPTAGDAEGLATIETEYSDPFNVQLMGTILPPPDFSDIVLRGDFDFAVGMTTPFYEDEIDGHKVVRSAQIQWNQQSSKLDMTFTVPEGKLGKVSWKGVYQSAGWYYAGGFFVDDLSTPYKTYSDSYADASETVELAPGKHTIRFQFDCYASVQDASMVANSYYGIWDLALDTEDLKADAAVLKDDLANVGFSILGDDGKSAVTDNIVLTNKGGNDLKLISVTSDNSEFSGSTQVEPAATMKDLVIPITLSTTTAGDKAANLTIKTSAGTFTAKAKGTVIAQQDFSKVVTEGYEYMTVENDPSFPYIVDGDSAYNANAAYDDDMVGTSQVTFRFTIPEGKMGTLSWDGYTYDQTNYGMDYGQLILSHPMRGYMSANWKTGPAGSGDFSSSDEPNFLNCVPGDHYISFQYLRNGDGDKVGKSMYSFKNLKLHVIDFSEHAAELLQDKAEFKSCYVGPYRWTKATVTLKNLGSAALSVDTIIGAGPFSGTEVTETASFGNTLDVTLFFYPKEKGEYSDDVIIRTNAGDFKVACTGKTLDDTGIIYNGDLEDQCYGWGAYDADGDNATWTTAYMLFGGGQTEEGYSRYCHSGSNLLGSASMSAYGEAITPDNWAVSPAITIPEEGGVLSYYVASLDPKHCAENYTVYISETDDYTKIDDEGEVVYDGLYELPEQYDLIPWNHYEFNLDRYKGKTIYVAFRHHDCSGQYLLMIDDIFVYQHGYEPSTGIGGVTAKDGAKQVESIYSADGRKLNQFGRGLNIVRMADGSTRKVAVK